MISKNWIDKWKLYSKYEIIKSIFLGKEKIDEQNLKNLLIYYKEQYKEYKYEELNILKIIDLKTRDKMEAYLQNDSLVVVNI